ncbi:hemolysin family protein [Thermocrinis minervae]|uniref:hemolysin family protein n=1 Tax=Thermocrinis minervae TaxID=381751 RepID=UPI001E513FAA|nr:hemolysin family protein [Thermocrinis minervae]
MTFLIATLLSAFFSSSEVVFFGSNRFLVSRYYTGKLYKLIDFLLSRPREILLVILIGNELVNVFISSYSVKVFSHIFGPASAGYSVIFASLLIFIFGEVIPKNAVLSFTNRLIAVYSIILYPFYVLSYPIRLLARGPLENLVNNFGLESIETSKKEHLFWEIFDTGFNEKVFDQEDRELVEKALTLNDATVREVMKPKPDVFMLDEDMTVQEAWQYIVEQRHTKIPVYRESTDTVTGVVHVEDLLPIEENLSKRLGEFKRKVLFVPEVMSVEDLLKEFAQRGVQIAIVVGEHGEVTGLVTIHDILSYVMESLPISKDIQKLSYNTYKVMGWTDIEEFAKFFNIELPEEYDYDTVAGFVMSLLSKVPEEDEEVVYQDYKIKIEKMEGNRIISLLVVKE